MKTAKKTIKTILALLPLMGVMILFLTSFNAKTETYPNNSLIELRLENEDKNGYLTPTDPTALNAKIVSTMYGKNYNLNDDPQKVVGLRGTSLTLAKFANTLSEITGIPLTYTLIPLWYAFYLFMIEFFFMIMNIITFVPRKCSEFFGG